MSGLAIAGIPKPYDVNGVFRTANFNSRKCSPGKQNCNTADRELLALVETPKQWWQYHEGSRYTVLIRCDHKTPDYFYTSRVLCRRQAMWSEIIAGYDFVMEQLDGTKNPADGPSR